MLEISGQIKLILPIIVGVFYLIRYLKTKEKMNFFIYFFFAMFPFVSSNFSIPIYRDIGKTLIFAGVGILALSFLANKRSKIIINPYLTALLVIIAFSYTWALDRATFYAGFINFTYLFLGYVFISNTLKKEDFDAVGQMYRINGVILSLIAIGEYALTQTRVEVSFANPNYLGLYLLCAFVFYFHSDSKKKMLSIIAIAIFLTGSRAAILGMIIPFFVARKVKLKHLIITAVIIPIVVLGASQLGYLDRFQNAGGVDSSNDRKAVFEIAKIIFVDHPLTGIGYNNFLTQFKQYAPYTTNGFELSLRDQMATHNDLVKIFVELGLLGGIAFLIYLWKGFRSIQFLENKTLFYSLFCITVFYSMTHNNVNSIEFWLFTSVASFLAIPNKKESTYNRLSPININNRTDAAKL